MDSSQVSVAIILVIQILCRNLRISTQVLFNCNFLFPPSLLASHIAQPKREFSDLLGKIGEVCREWGEIRKKLFVDAHLYQFEHISRGIFELIEGRRDLLNQSLTQDQYRELTRKLCSRIDWGNRKLGLDLIPWNYLLEDGDDEVHNNKIDGIFVIFVCIFL